MTDLTPDDLELLMASLTHYRKHIREYHKYPDEAFRSEQLSRVDSTLARLGALGE